MKKTGHEKTEYTLSTWMTDLSHIIAPLKLNIMSLPSTHNAGMDKKATSGIEEGWIACQNDTFLFQLSNGIRVFDIRLKHAIEGIFFSHNGWTSTRTISKLIADCNHFFNVDYASKKNEIIILNFHDFEKFTEQDYSEVFLQLINGFSGKNSAAKILPRAASDLTHAQILTDYPGCNIIIAGHQFGIHTECWNNIPHYWIGQDVPSLAELDIFIDRHTKPTHKNDLWSLQVVKYSNTYGPENLAGYINIKFQPYQNTIINSNIINVDFFEKSLLVDYCIQANIYKGERALDKIPPTTPVFRHANWIRPWHTCFVSFEESTDNFTVTHHIYTIDDGEEQRLENQHSAVQNLELNLAPDTLYTLKVYGVDFAGNYSPPLTQTLTTFDEPTDDKKPLTPLITATQRIGKFGCAMYWGEGQTVDCYEAYIYGEGDIDEGKPIREPLLSKFVSRWAGGTMFENLPDYNAYQMAVRAVNSYGTYGDYSIRRVEPYKPSTRPPTAPSELKYVYDSVGQTLHITYIKGDAKVGTVFHTLIIETNSEQWQEIIYKESFTFPLGLSIDFKLTLYCTDQDYNHSTSISLTGNTRESGNDSPEFITDQFVTRDTLTSGSTTWSGARNIAQYKIHLYDISAIEDEKNTKEGTIIAPPIREVLYSGSELCYTFNDLTSLKPFHVFVWGINAYGTEGHRSFTNNTFMHASPYADQEKPTPPLHLTASYSTMNGNLLVFFNLSSDNNKVDHYIVTINDSVIKKNASPILGFHSITHPLQRNIPYTVSVYAVDPDNNRSSVVSIHGTTSDEDTQDSPPTDSYVLQAKRTENNTAQLTWGYIHNARYLCITYYLITENGEIAQPLVHTAGKSIGVNLHNIQPDKKYKVAVIGVNSYGNTGTLKFIEF